MQSELPSESVVDMSQDSDKFMDTGLRIHCFKLIACLILYCHCRCRGNGKFNIDHHRTVAVSEEVLSNVDQGHSDGGIYRVYIPSQNQSE